MRVQMLQALDKLGANYLEDTVSLKYLLCPIFAKNAAQQATFYELFDNYLSEIQAPLPEPPPPIKWFQKIPKWVYGVLLLCLASLLTYGIYKWFEEDPDPIIFFQSPSNVRVGDTLKIVNQSQHIGQEELMLWELLDQEGNIERRDTLEREYNWVYSIDSAGSTPDKVLKLTLLGCSNNPACNYKSSFRIDCINSPRATKDNWQDTVHIKTPIIFQLQNTDNLTEIYSWQVEEEENLSEVNSLIHTFTNQGFYTVKATIRREQVDGHCEQVLTHSIAVMEDQEIAPLYEKDLVKIPNTEKAYFKWTWWTLLGFLGGIPFLWLVYKWWNHRKIQKGKQQPIKELKQIFDAPDKPPYFIPFRSMNHLIQSGKNLYAFANTLRRRQEGLRKTLNVEKSLNATVAKGGYPHLKVETVTQPSEYLFLIDDQHRDSIQSRLFEYLVDFLQHKDVYAERYFYATEPFSIWKDKDRESLNLKQLQGLYPYHRLVIMGDAHQWLSQSGTDAKALKSNYTQWLERWKQKITLTPIPPVAWTYKEEGINHWSPVYPADIEGINTAFDALQDNLNEDEKGIFYKQWQLDQIALRPGEPTTNYRSWRKLAEIKDYLQNYPKLATWLYALAVHPVISWELTLAIGHALEKETSLVTFDNLLYLSRIPWLQKGSFPPKLRLQLLKELDTETERLARQTVKTELQAVEALTQNSFVNFELQAGLAVQNFLIDPNKKEHIDAIQALTSGKKPAIGKNRFKELDQQIRKYQLAKRKAATGLNTFLAEAKVKGEDDIKAGTNPYLKWIIFTCFIWLGNLYFSAHINGEDSLYEWAYGKKETSVNSIENSQQEGIESSSHLFVKKVSLPLNRAAELNNLAVDLYRERGVIDSVNAVLDQAGFIILKEASIGSPIGKNAEIIINNSAIYDYNQGVNTYKEYFSKLDTNYIWLAQSQFSEGVSLNNSIEPSPFYEALHGEGLSFWYIKDTLNAKRIYEQFLTPYLDTLSIEPNLKTFIEASKEVVENTRKPITVSGIVLDENTKKSIENVSIIGNRISTITNKNGFYSFQINNVEIPNLTSLTYQKEGYIQKTIKSKLSEGETRLPILYLTPTGNNNVISTTSVDVFDSLLVVELKSYILKARSYILIEKKEEAVATLELATGVAKSISSTNSEIAKLLVDVGEVYLEIGESTMAFNSFRKAVRIDSTLISEIPSEYLEGIKTPTLNTFTDPRDNQTYKTITIGTQTWFAQNLNFKTPDSWCYLELDEFCEKAGRLYTWEAAKTVCPKGWHLPTFEEWNTLLDNFEDSGQAYLALKDGGQSNFAALLGGMRNKNGEYIWLDRYGLYWSNGPWYLHFDAPSEYVVGSQNNRQDAMSCRCLKD